MIVAVTVVRVMKMAVDQIVDVVAVRDRLVPAVRAMMVSLCVPRAGVLRRAN